MDAYFSEKLMWSDQDFEAMGWHDATLWSMVASPDTFEFLVDIDYIFNWVHPGPDETYFKFWVAPVTMVFENASNIRVNIDSQQGCIEIAELQRELVGPSPNGKYTQYRFKFKCQEGEVELEATSFKMYVRRPPALLEGQFLGLLERGGVSFSCTYSGA